MNKLVSRQIIEINRKLSGNCSNEKTIKKLNAILLEIYSKDKEGFYIFRDSVSKAAKLACELYNQKPFANKNLATAIYTAFILLQVNGIALTGYDNDLKTLQTHIINNDNFAVESWINKYNPNNMT